LDFFFGPLCFHSTGFTLKHPLFPRAYRETQGTLFFSSPASRPFHHAHFNHPLAVCDPSCPHLSHHLVIREYHGFFLGNPYPYPTHPVQKVVLFHPANCISSQTLLHGHWDFISVCRGSCKQASEILQETFRPRVFWTGSWVRTRNVI
jgi:hypothetical protein